MRKDQILTSYCTVFSSYIFDKEVKENLDRAMVTEGLENNMYEKLQ